MKAKKVIKAIAFMLIFGVLFFSVQALLYGDSDTRDYKKVTAFFEEREESLDAVFLGSSATYAFWTPAFAYGEYGITVYPLSTARQMLLSAKYLIDDARKTQPDALYIVNLVSVETTNNYVHRLLDGYPNTLNKYKMIKYLSDKAGYSLSERMEYYFPIVRFHSRWSELVASDFKTDAQLYKGSCSYNSFLTKAVTVNNKLWSYSERISLPQELEDGINDLMDYCEEENVKVLFVITPQGLQDDVKRGQQNTLMDIVKARGFDVLDVTQVTDEIGLNLKTDYYDKYHTNLHGSLKVTDYISRYLVENYGFEDKRGDENYADWEKDTADYYKLVEKHFSDEDMQLLPSIK